jgi:hypothetical protein
MIEGEIRRQNIGPSSIPVKTLMAWTISKGGVQPSELVAAAEWASTEGYITEGPKGGPGGLGSVTLTPTGHKHAIE